MNAEKMRRLSENRRNREFFQCISLALFGENGSGKEVKLTSGKVAPSPPNATSTENFDPSGRVTILTIWTLRYVVVYFVYSI